jgi:hypothetical protein
MPVAATVTIANGLRPSVHGLICRGQGRAPRGTAWDLGHATQSSQPWTLPAEDGS